MTYRSAHSPLICSVDHTGNQAGLTARPVFLQENSSSRMGKRADAEKAFLAYSGRAIPFASGKFLHVLYKKASRPITALSLKGTRALRLLSRSIKRYFIFYSHPTSRAHFHRAC